MTGAKLSINERVLAVLADEDQGRIPFIGRMDFWYKGLTYQNKLPGEYAGKDLQEIHRSIGFGRQEWLAPCAFKYRGLELVVYFEGQEIIHETDPEIAFFPDLWGIVPADQAGEFITELRTPVGKLVCAHRVTEASLRSGTTRPILIKPPVAEPGDFMVYEYLIERSEFVPYFERFSKKVEEVGGWGFLVPTLNRVPFQSVLIDVMGEIACFFGLYDYPEQLERLIKVIDLQTTELLENLAGFEYPYIEFVDNLEGMMTNPRLFQRFALPSYQKYSEIAHNQGKKLGSHTDGDLKNLVPLLANSGLDVCESFTPAPLTGCTLEEALNSWGEGPLIWGGIPSYYLEERVPEDEFRNYVHDLLSLVKERPIILGVADAVMADNLLDRVAWISQQIEGLTI